MLGVPTISLGILSVLLSVVTIVSSLSVGRILLGIVRILGITCVLSTTHILSIILILSNFGILRISCLAFLVLLGIIVVPSLGISFIFCVLLSGVPCCILGIIVVVASFLRIRNIACTLLLLITIFIRLGISCLACIILCISARVCLCSTCAFLADETAGSDGALVDTAAVRLCEVPGDEICEAAASWCGRCDRHACQESCDDDEVMHLDDGILFVNASKENKKMDELK